MIPRVLFENDGKLAIEDICMGMAKVGKGAGNNKRYAIVNKEGIFLTDFIFNSIKIYSEGYAAVGKTIKTYSDERGIPITKSDYGLVDTDGNLAIPLEYEDLGICKEGLINAKRNEKWGYITPKGEKVVPFIYDEAHPFSEGLASVKKNDKYGFIDKKGNVRIDFRYIWTHDFSDGLCFVQGTYATAKSSLTYINKSGNVVVRIKKDIFGKYGMPSDYNEGVMVLNRYKVVTKDGRLHFELDDRYRMKDFYEGLSCVYDTKTDKYGYIDTNGKFIIPCKYSKCFTANNHFMIDGMIGVQDKNLKWGIINSNGKIILPQEYSKLYGYSDGRVLAKKDNSIYSIDVVNK